MTLLNFTATEQGLEEQMLTHVVAKEEPEREQKRQQNIIKLANNSKEQQDLELKILRLLQDS